MVLSKDLKFAICFGLIFGAIFSVFQVIGYCAEDIVVTPTIIENLGFNGTGAVSNIAEGVIVRFYIEPGYDYTLHNNSNANTGSFKLYGFSDDADIEVGTVLNDVGRVEKASSISIDGYENQYLYLYAYNYRDDIVLTATPIVADGMDGFISQLVYSVGTEGLWSTFLACVPLLVLAVLWGLGFFLIVRFVIGIVKARGGV